MEAVSKEKHSWSKSKGIPLNLGRFFSGNDASPIISHSEESWNSITYRPQGQLSGFREFYENIGSVEFENVFSEKTFESRSLDPVIAELSEQHISERIFIASVSSNSSVTEDRIPISIDFSEQDSRFFPDFVEIKKWINFILIGSDLIICKGTSQEETEIPIEYASPDVLLEIRKENLQHAISSAISISREVFRNLHDINVKVAYDPEIPKRKTFRIVLFVSGNPIDVLNDERKFKKHLYSTLDAAERGKITATYRWENK